VGGGRWGREGTTDSGLAKTSGLAG
jgi:hypothetical protein